MSTRILGFVEYPGTGEQAFLDADHTKLDTLVDVRDKLIFAAPTELTITSGAITVTQTRHTVDTYGNGPTDDLTTIHGGSEGQMLFLNSENELRNVVLKSLVGNIDIPADITLDYPYSIVCLIYTNSYWTKVS